MLKHSKLEKGRKFIDGQTEKLVIEQVFSGYKKNERKREIK